MDGDCVKCIIMSYLSSNTFLPLTHNADTHTHAMAWGDSIKGSRTRQPRRVRVSVPSKDVGGLFDVSWHQPSHIKPNSAWSRLFPRNRLWERNIGKIDLFLPTMKCKYISNTVDMLMPRSSSSNNGQQFGNNSAFSCFLIRTSRQYCSLHYSVLGKIRRFVRLGTLIILSWCIATLRLCDWPTKPWSELSTIKIMICAKILCTTCPLHTQGRGAMHKNNETKVIVLLLLELVLLL